MKKYIPWLLLASLLMIAARYTGNVFTSLRISTNGIVSEPVTATTEDITLYVRTTGADTNDGLTVGTALRQPQEAADRIPKHVEHNVTVDVGEGNFTGFFMRGFVFSADTVTLIKGTLGNPTLTTGTTSGTADGGSNIQLVDSTQNWTDHELRGRLILVDGEYRVARDNDTTTIDTVGTYSASVSGKAYEILEQKTVLNADGPCATSSKIMVKSCMGVRDSLNIQDFKTTGGTIGIGAWDTSGHTWTRLWVSGAYYGGLQQTTRGTSIIADCFFDSATGQGLTCAEVQGQIRIWNVYAYNSTGTGIFGGGAVSVSSTTTYLCADNNGGIGIELYSFNEFFADAVLAKNNTKSGLSITDAGLIVIGKVDIENNVENGIELYNTAMSLSTSGSIISGNTLWGIVINKEVSNVSSYVSSGGTLNLGSAAAIIESNGSGGIKSQYNGVVKLGDTTGINTGAHGLVLETGSIAQVTSTTAITGATGDSTINGGTTDLTWATDFAADGDMVINLDNACRIERKDP